MKQRDFQNCAACGQSVMANGVHFYRVKIDQHILRTDAIRRAAGLEMMLGNAAIASSMGPDEDLATEVGSVTRLVCATCALDTHLPIAVLMGEED